MENEELKALEVAREEIIKIKVRYQKKATKEREKVNNVYVTVRGEKCYTEAEINEWYESDYITCKQADKYIERLEQKKEKAGQKDYFTKSERIYNVLESITNNLSLEIRDIKIQDEEERKRNERWEIAQEQGMSYSQWLELEDISRQSEEYEQLMGIKSR